MRISKDESIAGQPAVAVRDALKRLGDRPFDVSRAAWALRLSDEEAAAVVDELVRLGYLEELRGEPNDRRYQTTLLGNALSMASAGKPFKRSTARRALEDFLERVREVNECEDYVFWVDTVILFGSYLTSPEDEPVGDVDLAVGLESRFSGSDFLERSRARADLAQDEGRRFSNYVEYLGWAETEVLLHLKGRSPVLSLAKTDDRILEVVEQRVIYSRRASGREST